MTRTDAVAKQERLFPRTTWERVEATNGVVDWEHCPTLPEICFDVRHALNGAADPWPDDFLRKVQAMLEHRMATWEWRGHPPSLEYAVDAAVYAMVGATVEMIAEYLKAKEIV